MKANELMIGDWVLFEPLKESISTERVIGLGEGVVKIRQFWVSMKEIKPIPLTAEILEKNGFAVHRQFETFTEYWLDIPQKWVRVAPNSYIEIYNGENRNVHIDGKVYVHELQHALRLCGINKEIVL